MERPLTGKIPRERIGALELPRLQEDVLAFFRNLQDLSGVVSDALDELGLAGAIPSSVLKPTDAKARLCGPALTVLNRPLGLPVAHAVQANVSRLGEIEAHNLASRGIGYPVWCKGASPITSKWRIETVAINVPVAICGVPVKPGDLVVADEVGVCFVPHERAAQVLAAVRRMLNYEEERMRQIAAGVSVPDLAKAPRR